MEDLWLLFDRLGVYDREENRGLENLRAIESRGGTIHACERRPPHLSGGRFPGSPGRQRSRVSDPWGGGPNEAMSQSMSSLLQRKCACGGTPGPTGECAECRKKQLGLQRKEVAPAPTVASPAALPSPLGHDFGRMRVHPRLQRKPADREDPGSCGLFDVRMVTIPGGLRGIISFKPDPGTCPTCTSIRLVQIARVFEKPGEPYIWSDFERGRENVKTRENTRKGVKGGYFVDHLSMQCSQGAGCGIYYRDHFPHATKSHDGSNDGTAAITASLWDEPTGKADDVFELETCARCHDTGDFLGCVEWGFTNDANGQATASPTLQHDAPSATFLAALKAFNRYYKNPRR